MISAAEPEFPAPPKISPRPGENPGRGLSRREFRAEPYEAHCVGGAKNERRELLPSWGSGGWYRTAGQRTVIWGPGKK